MSSSAVSSIAKGGVFTALVTPFSADGSTVDHAALEKIVEFQIADGIAGLVPVGTTGESPALSNEEHQKVVETVVKVAAGRVPIIAGCGSNHTASCVSKTQMVKDAGADACLVVNPYYNKPSQEGLYQHIKAVAAVGLPIVLYNIPGRTGITMSPATVARVFNEFKEVIAIKEATGSLEIATEIASLCDIIILSGDDALTLPLIAIGGKGVISVLSNISPAKMNAIVHPALAGDFEKARDVSMKTFKLMKTMFIETNPQPIKECMELLGFCGHTMRLPMVRVTDETRETLQKILAEYSITKL